METEMTWTPWIQIEADDTSNEEAKRLYKKAQNPLTGDLSDLIRITSLPRNLPAP
jgi:hypothetical protein